MINIEQFRVDIIQPTLRFIGHYSKGAENLVLGTALQESRLIYIRQLKDGPALGFYQMEPATHDDIWKNYLRYKVGLRKRVQRLIAAGLRGRRSSEAAWSPPHAEALMDSLCYATAMCRIHYLRVPEPLPGSADIEGMGWYWKEHYNTSAGKGKQEEWTKHFRNYVIDGR